MNRQQRRQLQRRGDDNGHDVPDGDDAPRPALDGALAVAPETEAAPETEGEGRSSRTARHALAPSRHRVGPRQFLHEVNVEMRKVAWPTRTETINYSTVVLITLALLMALIFGLDVGFQHLANFIFNP